jgi:hypothetical protein
MLNHGLLSYTLIGGANFTLQDGFNRPALIAGQRAGFDDLNLITHLATDLIMRLHTHAGKHHLLIKRVTKLASDLHHNGFGHFIAGNDTSYTTTIVHFAPSTAAFLSASAEWFPCGQYPCAMMFRRLASVN